MSKIKKEFLKKEKVKIIQIILKSIPKDIQYYSIKKNKPFFISANILGLGSDNKIYEFGREWCPEKKEFKKKCWVSFGEYKGKL